MNSYRLALVSVFFYIYIAHHEVQSTTKKDFDEWDSDRICTEFDGPRLKFDADGICKKAVQNSTGGKCDRLLVKLNTDGSPVEENHLLAWCQVNAYTYKCVGLADADNKAIIFSYEHGRRLCYNGQDPIEF